MTPSERERRIEAGMRAWLPLGSPPSLDRRVVASILDAADEAVPTVSQWVKDEQQEILDRQFWDMRVTLTERAERAEKERDDWKGVYENYRDDAEESIARAKAAARGFAKALREIENHPWRCWRRITATRALNDHPSFSGEEGEGAL